MDSQVESIPVIGHTPRRTTSLSLLIVVLAVLALSGCGGDRAAAKGEDPKQVDSTALPEVGKCRNLTHEDVAEAYNFDKYVPCDEPHNAETFGAGPLPDEFKDAEYGDEKVNEWAFSQCRKLLEKYVGSDQSLLMRSMLSHVYFGPSEKAWDEGARWIRCDVVGGGQQGAEYVDLPTTTRNLLKVKKVEDVEDRWMVCAEGKSVSSAKVPCSEPHQMRAVTTIKLGEAKTKFLGVAESKKKASQYCKGSVQAWLGYPESFDYGYTWFGEKEWNAGNRWAVCWAVTEE